MTDKKKAINSNDAECVCGHTLKEHSTTSGWCTSWFVNSKHLAGCQCRCTHFQPDVTNNKKVIDLKDVPDGMTLKQHIENLEQGQGIIHQIEDKKAPYGSVEGELTVEKLMSFLQDITAKPDAPKPMILITGCIDQGIVYQSEQFNLCNNSDCKNCRGLEDALKEQCK